MSVGFLVLVFTSIVDTVSLATKALLPSAVNATPAIQPLSRVGFFLFAKTLRAWVGQLKEPMSVGGPH
jgi:hypothetical protein